MTRTSRFLLLLTGSLVAAYPQAQPGLSYLAGSLARDEPQPVYSADPSDSWNRIFYHLFTRVVEARLSSEFSGGFPLQEVRTRGIIRSLRITTTSFTRIESGDHAIDPFYPSFISSLGALDVLSEARYPQLKQALTDALAEKDLRPPLHRALMQSDLWAAYDILQSSKIPRDAETRHLAENREQLLSLFARFIRKLALTPSEIAELPDNYSAAAKFHTLPNLFAAGSDWMEVQWITPRIHDSAADFRRAARVFVRPSTPPNDKLQFLNSLLGSRNRIDKLNVVALVIQLLLIADNGKVVPSPLVFAVQVRSFARDEQGGRETTIQQYELSRAFFLKDPASGGLESTAETSPAYLPAAGNDYTFVSPQRFEEGNSWPPILVTLRARCVSCHGREVTNLFTFSGHSPNPVPPVVRLEPSKNDRARHVALRKMEQEDWKGLLRRWSEK